MSASSRARRDGATERRLIASRKRLIVERPADHLAPPQRGEGQVVRIPHRPLRV
jgi:hypothetical protein